MDYTNSDSKGWKWIFGVSLVQRGRNKSEKYWRYIFSLYSFRKNTINSTCGIAQHFMVCFVSGWNILTPITLKSVEIVNKSPLIVPPLIYFRQQPRRNFPYFIHSTNKSFLNFKVQHFRFKRYHGKKIVFRKLNTLLIM